MIKRNPLILVPIFLACAAILYGLMIVPTAERIQKNRQSADQLRQDSRRRAEDIRDRADVERKLAAVNDELDRFAKLHLEPLLESYAMRAKGLVDGLAVQAGLTDVSYVECSPLALPVLPGAPLPAALHCRRLVKVSCQGDYAAIVSFILMVEEGLPHVVVSGLRIESSGNGPEVLAAEVLLEWPAKGEPRK